MKTSEQINELAAALAKAQATIKNPSKDKKNPHFKSSYADIASGLEVIRPALSAQNISFVQATDVVEDGMVLVTRLMHGGSGQWIEGTYPVGKFGPHQQMAASLTYSKRMALFALVGVHGEDEDDDGESAGTADVSTRRPAPAPARRPAPVRDESPSDSQLACKTAIINKFIAAPTVEAINAEWKWAVSQMNLVDIKKEDAIYNEIVHEFGARKIELQERNKVRSEAAE